MLSAAVAGISPVDFYSLTIGEISIAIEAYHERERQSLVSRVSAVIRGLSTLGKKKTDPFQGLGVKGKQTLGLGALKRGAKAWLFKPED